MLFQSFKRTALLAEVRRSMALAAPLIGAHLLQTANALVDTLVAGQLGYSELGAGGIAAGMWFFCSLLCIGLMAGLSPALSKMIGERRRAAVGATYRQGLWLGLAVGTVAMGLLWVFILTVHQWSLQAQLVPFIRQYLYGACWGLPAFAIVMACRNVFEATGVTRPVLLVQAIGLAINLCCDIGFGLGYWGLPRLGLLGIGFSTSLVMICMAIVLLWRLRAVQFSRYQLFANFEWPNWQMIAPMLVMALPIYLGLVFEAGLFFATALQMGMLGTAEAAAHNIAISVASICYMLPLGLSLALTARVGCVYGRQLAASLKIRIAAGLLLMTAMGLATVSVLIIARYPLTGLYTEDVQLRTLAAQLILLAALFQLSDAAQVTLLGILRGLQDVRIPMLINLVSYWGIAFLVGYYAAHHAGWGALGLWFGLVVGLLMAAVMLGCRLWVISLRTLQQWRSASGFSEAQITAAENQ